MGLRFSFLTGLLLISPSAHAQTVPFTQSNPDSLRVVWTDVNRFWRAYDQLPAAATTADSLAIIQTRYLDPATPGLRVYMDAAHASAADFLRAIRTHRRYLTAIRPATLAIGQQQAAIVAAARKLKKAYPASVFPNLYFAIGKFEVGGTQFGNLLYVGAELKCTTPAPPLSELHPDLRGSISPVEAISTVCIHEMVHAQQQLQNSRTNLAGALREGAAEFMAFRLTGRLGAPQAFAYAKRHEAEVRRQFALEADQPIVAKWFLATPGPATKQPGALGYYIGFRICEAHYKQARDKRAALQTIITLSNLPVLTAQGHKYLAPTSGVRP